MLGTILKLLRPSYALTALILFGGWQGYAFVKSIPDKLSLPFGISSQVQSNEKTQIPERSQSVESKQIEPRQTSSNPTVAAIQKIHPGMRMVSWAVIYMLMCFATVPLIKKMLAHESNLVNAILIIIYSGVGFLLAVVFTAFQFNWHSTVMLIMALILSASMIIWLASELEKVRVQDSFVG
jgi:hypothetical protein